MDGPGCQRRSRLPRPCPALCNVQAKTPEQRAASVEAAFSRVVHTAEWVSRQRFLTDRELRKWDRLVAWKAHDASECVHACLSVARVAAVGWVQSWVRGRGLGRLNPSALEEQWPTLGSSDVRLARHLGVGAHSVAAFRPADGVCPPRLPGPRAARLPIRPWLPPPAGPAGGRPILLARLGRAQQLVKPERYEELASALLTLVHRGLTCQLSNAAGAAEKVTARRGQGPAARAQAGAQASVALPWTLLRFLRGKQSCCGVLLLMQASC